MSKSSKALSIFAVGVAVGLFLNSSKRGEYIKKARRKIREWRNNNKYYEVRLLKKYHLTEDPIDEIAR